MPGERGEYRPIFTRLVNGPDFKTLSADARSCFYPVKLRLPAAGIGVIPALEAVLVEDTALPLDQVSGAVKELESQGWIRRQGSVVWLVRGLEFEPTLNVHNTLHRKHIQETVKSLPTLEIVDEFRVHYADWFRDIRDIKEGDSGAPPEAIESPSKASRSTTPTPTPSPTPVKETRQSRRVGDAAGQDREASPLNQVAAAVRQHWWQPDGKPPPDWSMGRELSIWKPELGGSVSIENALKAIEGLRALADSGEVDWLKKGAKLTARALFHSHNGALRMYPRALNAYYAGGENPKGRRRSPAATPIGDVVGRMSRSPA
jgi:hypothetical protein